MHGPSENRMAGIRFEMIFIIKAMSCMDLEVR
jgi:hypothetical protein